MRRWSRGALRQIDSEELAAGQGMGSEPLLHNVRPIMCLPLVSATCRVVEGDAHAQSVFLRETRCINPMSRAPEALLLWTASPAAVRPRLRVPVILFHFSCRICSSCRMEPVERRLEKLDSEIADLTAKEEAAESRWLSATDSQQERKLKEVYEYLKKEKDDRLSQRHDLQLRLPSSGEHTARPASCLCKSACGWQLPYSHCRLEVEGYCVPNSILAAEIAESPGHMGGHPSILASKTFRPGSIMMSTPP